MSEGTSLITREQVQQARWQNHLLRSQIELGHLEKVVKLQGSSMLEGINDFWVNVVSDRLSRWQDDRYEFWGYGSYGQRNRRLGTNWPIYENEEDLRRLWAQARILASTNSLAIGLIEGLTSYLLGDGFVYRAASKHSEKPQDDLADAIQDLIDQFLESANWYGGTQPGLEAELFRRTLRDGEYFLCGWPEPDGRYEVRVLEPEQITQPPGSLLDEWLFGIRVEPRDVQKHLGYWVVWGDYNAVDEAEEIGPDRIVHVRRNVDRGIKRGLTDFSFNTHDNLRQVAELRKNMAAGAAMQASYAGVRQHETSTRSQVEAMADLVSTYTLTNPDTNNKEYFGRSPVGMVDIPKGMSFVMPPNAQNASAHVEILQAILRTTGQRWNAPEWLSSGDSANSNYSSSLTADSQFVRRITREQRDYKSAFLVTIWRAVEHAIKSRGGSLIVRVKQDEMQTERTFNLQDIKRLIEIQVEATSPEARNKLEEAQRAQIYVPMGILSPQTVQQQQGLDPEQEQVNNDEWQEKNGQQGQPLGLPGDQGMGDQGGGQPPPEEAPPDELELPPPIEESLEEQLDIIATPEWFAQLRETISTASAAKRELLESREKERGDMMQQLCEQVAELARPKPRRRGRQVINVTSPPVTVNMPEQTINLPEQQTTINVPEASVQVNVPPALPGTAPTIVNEINVPTAAPPVVNVDVRTPKRRRTIRTPKRDAEQNIERVIEVHEYDDGETQISGGNIEPRPVEKPEE